jgi:hypothetical protein
VTISALDLSTTDGEHNRGVIQAALDTSGAVTLPSRHVPVTGGLVMAAATRLAGSGRTVLAASGACAQPVVHVLGTGVAIHDLTITLPVSEPGPHDGARFTAVTIGDYLYPASPDWIDRVSLRRVRVQRPAQCPANSIAVMGAVRGLGMHDIRIDGGGTGVAVHWGAVASSVSEITGPSFHPHDLHIDGLRVRDAFEAFYLSSVHDVAVRDFHCDNVEIGFRLLPGDNADSYHEDPAGSQVSRRIVIRDGRIRWRGIYAIRVAGWGRSEVDRALRRLPYRDVSVAGCELTAMAPAASATPRPRAAVVLEYADGVRFSDIAIRAGAEAAAALIDGQPASLDDLRPTVPSRKR